MSDGGAFSMGFANAYRMMMDREEKKRKQDANLALTNAYLEMEEQRRQSQIAPQKQAFDAATGNAVDAQRRQNSVAIANSAGQQNLMTPEIKEALAQSGIPVGEIPANVNPALTQTAGGQPVTPDMQQAFGSSAMTGLQSANTQANQAQQLLAEAEKRYPPSVLAKMAPLVSKGVPFEKLYAFAESENAKEINRTKTAELNKAYKEVFSNKDLTDEQRAIMLLSVNPSDPIGKMFAERSGKKDLGFTLGQGQTRFDSQGRPIVSVAPKPDKHTGQLTDYQKWQIANQQNKEPKKPEWEKEHHDYEKTHGMNDAQLVQEYWAMSQDPAQSALITPEKQAKYNVASARVNKYLAQPNLTKDEQDFLSSLDRSKLTQEQGFKMLQQYRMNKLNGIRQ